MRLIETKTVYLFDLFNTLVDVVSGDAETLPFPAEILNVNPRDYERAFMNSALTERRYRGRDRTSAEIMRKIANAIDPTIPEEIVLRASELRMRKYRNAILSPRTPMVETLRALKAQGKRLALVSNADRPEVEAWSASPFAPLFDAVVFSWSVGFIKPEPEIYTVALERLNAEAEHAVFVGDGGSNEHEGANALGIVTVSTDEFIRERKSEAECAAYGSTAAYHIHALRELLTL